MGFQALHDVLFRVGGRGGGGGRGQDLTIIEDSESGRAREVQKSKEKKCGK